MSHDQTETRAQERRRLFIADWNHLVLIGAVIATVWLLVTALLVIEIRRTDQDLDILSSKMATEIQQAYDQGYAQGQSRGRIDSVEDLIVQVEQRLQAAELTLGLRAERRKHGTGSMREEDP